MKLIQGNVTVDVTTIGKGITSQTLVHIHCRHEDGTQSGAVLSVNEADRLCRALLEAMA